MLHVGQVYQSTITVYGQQTAPSTGTLTISKPDGTSESHAGPWDWVQDGQDWTASYDYTLAAAGMHMFAWVTQGPGTAPDPEFIYAGAFRSILSTSQAKDHLNITRPLSVAAEAELHRFMQGSTELVEEKIGPVLRRRYSDRVYESDQALLVHHKPILAVISVTSVWQGGPVWGPDQIVPDKPAGIITPQIGFPFWWGPWDVVYDAGRDVIEERWFHAAAEQLRHLWETQRGAQPPAVLEGEEIYTATSGWSFSVPRRVLELLEQDMVPSS